MNVPVYFNFKAKLGTAGIIGVVLLMPVIAFIAGYLFNGYDVSVAVLSSLFCFGLAGLTLILVRKMLAKYFVNRPAFILKDDVIETSSGNRVSWEWFDKAVVFTCDNVKLLGLHRKPEVKKSTIGASTSDFDGVMFGFPFAIQFDQFSTGERDLIKLFQTKLPVVVDHKKFNIGDEINWEIVD